MRPPATITSFLFLLLIPAMACQTTARPSGRLDRGLHGAEMSSAQLNVHMADLVLYFVGSVERAADRIMAASNGDPAVRTAALRWKIYTVPAVLTAAFHDDPLAGYLDLRIFAIQSHRFFATGAGRDLFGEHQQVAIATCKDLEQRITRLGFAITRDRELRKRARVLTENLAEADPLQDLHFVRRPLDPQAIKGYIVDARGVVDVAHDINRNITAIRRLIAVELSILPRQAGWQAQLTTLEMLQASGVDLGQTRAQAARLTEDLNTLTNTVDTLPDLVSSERSIILKDVGRLQARTISQLEAMLLQTQGWTEEQRRIVLEQVSGERQALLHAVDLERTAAVNDLRTSTDQAILHLRETADQLIDRIFRKILVLWLLVLLTTVLGVLLVRRLSPRR